MTHEFNIGEFRCLALSDGVVRYPPALLLAGATEEERSAVLKKLGEDPEQLMVPYLCLFIETGKNKILVDTGLGSGVLPEAGKLLESLSQAGIRPKDVDTVLLTHGHADHIGGLTDTDGAPNFPNARYVMWQSEWKFWTSEGALDSIPPGPFRGLLVSSPRKNLPPIKPNIELLDRPREVAYGVEMIPTPGHTVGHSSLCVTSRNEQLFVIADAVVHRAQLGHPAWGTSFDQNPSAAVATRRSLAERAAADEVRVMAYHFPFPGLGRIVANGSAWRWEPDSLSATAQ